MNIHEYQAKAIISRYGIKIPAGRVAYTPLEAKNAASAVSQRGPWVLKAQIQSGARPKGHFLEKSAGKGSGIRQVTSRREIIKEATAMLGATLVTPQTDKKGKTVTRLYVEAFHKINKIFYTGLAIDRVNAVITLLLANLEKNSITEIASFQPDKILRLPLDLKKGISAKQVKEATAFLELNERYLPKLKKYLQGLFKVFKDTDALMLEINPAGIDNHGDIVALDAKLSIDDKALYRQPQMVPLFDAYEIEE